MMKLMFSSAALLALAGTTAFGQVVLNEIVIDDASTDDQEYIELYNAGGGAVDITGWTIEGVNGANGAVYTTHTIGAFVLAAGDFHVVAQNTGIPNSDEVSNASTAWQNGSPDALRLVDTTGTSGAAGTVDALGYEFRSSGAGSLAGGGVDYEGVGGSPSIQGGPTTVSFGRYADGVDTDNNAADWGTITATPGLSNTTGAVALPYTQDFNAAAGTSLTEFGSEFVTIVTADPASTGATNPNIIPASPAGGNIGLLWDSSGGGDSAHLTMDPIADGYVECYAWLSGTPASTEALGDGDGWSIILRGSTGVFYNGSETFNGDTGITIQNRNDDGALFTSGVNTQRVQFREEADNAGAFDGSSAPLQVLREETYSTDGWVRLRLDCNGTDVATFFGGTYGTTTDEAGSRQDHTVTWTSPGILALGFREGMTDNSQADPLRIDGLTLSDTGQVPVELSVFTTN